MIDSRAAEASPEKVFVLTRMGLSNATSGRIGKVAQAMCEDPGVTLWSEETMKKKFGDVPAKDKRSEYDQYLGACREAMDGICVLDFPVDYWANDFLVDLINADFVTTVILIDPGYDTERFGVDDGSGFDSLDFLDLKE